MLPVPSPRTPAAHTALPQGTRQRTQHTHGAQLVCVYGPGQHMRFSKHPLPMGILNPTEPLQPAPAMFPKIDPLQTSIGGRRRSPGTLLSSATTTSAVVLGKRSPLGTSRDALALTCALDIARDRSPSTERYPSTESSRIDGRDEMPEEAIEASAALPSLDSSTLAPSSAPHGVKRPANRKAHSGSVSTRDAQS